VKRVLHCALCTVFLTYVWSHCRAQCTHAPKQLRKQHALCFSDCALQAVCGTVADPCLGAVLSCPTYLLGASHRCVSRRPLQM
jgi:hypothetical protein